VPQVGQKLRLTPGDDAQVFGGWPVHSKRLSGMPRKVVTGEAVCRRQLSQWQWQAQVSGPSIR